MTIHSHSNGQSQVTDVDQIGQTLDKLKREGTLTEELVPLWEDWKWLKASNLALALDEVEETLKREVVMGEAEKVAITLWIAHTYRTSEQPQRGICDRTRVTLRTLSRERGACFPAPLSALQGTSTL